MYYDTIGNSLLAETIDGDKIYSWKCPKDGFLKKQVVGTYVDSHGVGSQAWAQQQQRSINGIFEGNEFTIMKLGEMDTWATKGFYVNDAWSKSKGLQGHTLRIGDECWRISGK